MLADEHQHQQQQQPPQRPPVNIPTSSSNTSTTSSSQPLSLDALLAATPNRDPRIALESILAERNSLAAQNVQLWKLIEKQRTMYNNATKELDRLKAGTDRNGSTADSSLVSAVGAAAGASTTSSNRKTERGGEDRMQRAKLARTNSDDQGVFSFFIHSDHFSNNLLTFQL